MPEVKKRINDMARIMCGHQNNKCPMHHDASCSHIGAVDCMYKQYAVLLSCKGYVHISDCEDVVNQIKVKSQVDILNRLKVDAVKLSPLETYHICNLVDDILKEINNEQNSN